MRYFNKLLGEKICIIANLFSQAKKSNFGDILKNTLENMYLETLFENLVKYQSMLKKKEYNSFVKHKINLTKSTYLRKQ